MILVCGEALIDLVPRLDGALEPLPGGGPLNVSVGLARLGVPVELLTRLSTDMLGRRLWRHLETAGVGTARVLEGPEPTPLAVAGVGPDGQARYSFYLAGTAACGITAADLAAPLAGDVEALAFGTLSLALEPGATAYGGLLEREHDRRLVLLDPNIRPDVLADPDAHRRRMERWAAMAGVVKLSREDAAWLDPTVAPEVVARRLAHRGPALVVLTLGGDGLVAYRGADELHLAARPVVVVDTIGAGDAVAAGLLAGLRRAGALDRAAIADLDPAALAGVLRFAAIVAALTCARSGADPPRLEEVEEALGAAAGGSGGVAPG